MLRSTNRLLSQRLLKVRSLFSKRNIVKETFNDAISYRVVDNSVGYVKGRMPRMVDDLFDVVPRFYTRQELEDLLDD